jgi:hypothetical protein
MRKFLFGWAAGAALLLGSTAAQAGQLVYAQLTFLLGTLPPAVFSASGLLNGTATGTGAGAAWSVGAGVVPGGITTATIPSSAAPPITQIQFVINGNPNAGNFVASVDGNMAVTGLANVKAYGGLTLLGVPVTVGVPTTIQPPVVSGIGITGYANSWTTQTTTVPLTLSTTMGATMATLMGSNGLVNGGGTVVLVTGLNVVTSIAGQLPSFAVLVLQYLPDVPEPGTLLLLASGVAGLAAVGRRKLR